MIRNITNNMVFFTRVNHVQSRARYETLSLVAGFPWLGSVSLHTCETNEVTIMATNKQKADVKAARKNGETALKKFPKAKLLGCFTRMAEQANAGDAAAEDRAMAALDVTRLAHDFAMNNPEALNETVVKGWRDNVKTLTMELALQGNRFAELKEGKEGAAPTAKLTGYGNNVASIAKGVIEFKIDPCESESYREVRKEVEGARAEARRDADPDAAALEDAKARCVEAWDAVRKAMFDTGDAGNIDTLTAALDDMRSDIEAQLIAQADLDATVHAEAKAA